MKNLKIITFCLILVGCTESPNNTFPEQDGDRLYTTDSTFYIMSGDDTLSKLLNEKTLQIAE